MFNQRSIPQVGDLSNTIARNIGMKAGRNIVLFADSELLQDLSNLCSKQCVAERSHM